MVVFPILGAGSCIGTAVVCQASDQCHDGVCTSTGDTTYSCSNSAKANGTACTVGNFCHSATCTDGICTDSDNADLSTCKIVFLTSTLHDGNLGRLAGADEICQILAEDAGIGGTFKAWLSASGTGNSAAERLTHAAVPYKRLDKVEVAQNWTDLTDGDLAAAINIDESGHDGGVSTVGVWTGTATDGTTLPNTCSDWTTNAADGSSAEVGNRFATDERWTHASGVASCRFLIHLYCFEQ